MLCGEEYRLTLQVSRLGRHYFCGTLYHAGAVLIGADGLQLRPVSFRIQGPHGDLSGNGISNMDRRPEGQLLPQIDGTGPGELHPDDSGDQAGGQHSMGNAAMEHGVAGVILVDMGRIQVSGNPGEGVDVYAP